MASDLSEEEKQQKKRYEDRCNFASFLEVAIKLDMDYLFNRDSIRVKARELNISFL